LLLADQLDETRTELERVKATPPAPQPDKSAERQATALIESLTRRIEAIAEQLERA
jgi:hypothetical protein